MNITLGMNYLDKPADWKCPRFTIGGVVMIEQNFQWSLTPGTQPYTHSFVVPKGTINDIMKTIVSPTSISLEVTGGVKANPTERSLLIDQIYILEPKEIDPYNVMWTFADVRFSYRGKKMYYSYNKTRIKNEAGFGAAVPETDPSSLRRSFDSFKVGRYVPWTINAGYNPYNMREIVEMELEKLGINVFQNVEADQGAYILENIEAEGDDAYFGLQRLLLKSRLQLGIKLDGSLYVYSLDWYDKNRDEIVKLLQNNLKTRGSLIYDQDKNRIRPRYVTIKFPKKEEIRVVAKDNSGDYRPDTFLPIYENPPVWTKEEINAGKVIACENVIRINYPSRRYDNSGDYEIGEYVPMWEYLSSIGLDESRIRLGWFSNQLERVYARIIEERMKIAPTLNNENYCSKIITNIRQHYRQVYQIDLFWVDRMKQWETRRCGIIDNYSHFAPPAPLWADYCLISKLRQPTLAKRKALGNWESKNWFVKEEDKYRNKPTLGTITSINMQLGIFKVSYPPLIDHVVAEIIPSCLNPEKMPYASASRNISMMEQAELYRDFTLETLISVVWNANQAGIFNFPEKYLAFYFDYNEEGGIGPNMEHLNRLEYARYAVQEYDEDGLPKANPQPRNTKILDCIATSEAARLVNQFKNRLSGVVTLAGAVQNIELYGHMRSITYHFGSGGLETTIDMRDVPPAKHIEEILTQDMINYLYAHVSRGDNANENKAGGQNE